MLAVIILNKDWVYLENKAKMLSLLIIPVLITGMTSSFAQQSTILELAPTDDAYVVTDLNDPVDKQGLEKINTGSLKFLKLWYAWESKGREQNKVLSHAYLTFDLSKLSKDQINSAKLDMYLQDARLTANSRNVAVHLSTSSTWKELTLTHQNAPSFETEPIAVTPISAEKNWYEWDLTDTVRDNAGSKLTLVVLLEDILNKNEEVAEFASKEVDDRYLRPKLVIETAPITTTNESDFDMRIIGVIATVVAGGGIAIVLYMRNRKKMSNAEPVTTTNQEQQPTSTGEMSCPSCGRNVSKEFKICPYCERDLTQQKLKCHNCGKDISTEYKVCPYCGSRSAYE